MIPGFAALSVFVLATILTAGAQSPPPMPSEDLRAYQKAHSVIDWSPKEIRARKDLEDLQPAENPQDLPHILQAVGKNVGAFFEKFPNATATESIRWEVDNGSTRSSSTEDFRVFWIRGPAVGGENLEEYRSDLQGHAINYADLSGAPLLTSRFALALLYFDPHNQGACRYRYFGRQKLDEHETDVVGFAQIPEGDLRLANFADNRRTDPLQFQGLAWIDQSTQEIVRIETELLAPPPRSSLRKEITHIDFAPVHLPDITVAAVLPSKAVVDVWLNVDELLNFKGRIGTGTHREVAEGPSQYLQHSRNTHTFSDFKLYQMASSSGTNP
jgi:hypothetical protein